MTQPRWSARSESERDIFSSPTPPPSRRELSLTLSLNGTLGALLLMAAGLLFRLVIAYLIFPGQGFKNDIDLYVSWAQTLANHGPGGFYGNVTWTDYAPGYLYVLWLLGVLGNALSGPLGMPAADIIHPLVKLPAMLSDIAVAWLIYGAAKRWHSEKAGLIAAAFYLFIPITWYDSALWGQMDSVGALLLVAMALLLIDGRDEPATVLAMLAAVVKPQFAIGLLVVAGVVVGRYLLGRLPEHPAPSTGFWAAVDRRLHGWFSEQHGLRRLVACLISGIATFVAVITPFDLQQRAGPDQAGIPIIGQAAGFSRLVSDAAAYYNYLTVNAYNAWALVGRAPLSRVISSDTPWTYDSYSVLGLTASALGTLVFAVIALTVMGALVWRSDRTAIVLGLMVLAVAFFAVPTRVHERYLFPAFGIGALAVATSIGWRWWYIVLGLAGTANLHGILTLPREGYGTQAMRNLPLGVEMRSEPVIVIAALTVTGAFVALLAAFVWNVARPAFAEGLTGLRAWYATTAGAAAEPLVPSTEEEFWSWGDRKQKRGPQGTRSIGRMELAVAGLLVLLTFGFRLYQLGTPRGMYFDEIFYTGAATEFLQDWRYGMPHELTETTHPPLGKYFVAAGIALAGDNKVTDTEPLAWPITSAAFEPTYVDPTSSSGRSGDRIILTTPAGVVVAEHGDLANARLVALPGAQTVAVDTDLHRIFVGTSGGVVWQFSSESLGGLATYGTAPLPAKVATFTSAVTGLRPVSFSNLIVQTGDGLSLVDLSSGQVINTLKLPSIWGVESYNVDGVWLVLATTPDGLLQLDPATLAPSAQFRLLGGAKAVALVYGNAQQKDWRNLLAQPTIYVATGTATMELITVATAAKPDGTKVASLTDWGGFAMPGTVTDVSWNRATNLLHVLGKTRDGTPTIFVVEPNTNSTFADAQLQFMPAAWVVDAQPNDPSSDRERVVAFSGAGTYSVIDAGSNAFAWRLPAVLAGALLAGLLFLLAMVLFRRLSVGLIFAALISLDGLIFGRSRIAGVDVYLALFIVAALLALAYLLQSRASGRRALFEGLLLLPLTGVLLGLAIGTKWPGLYALGAAVLIVLLRSRIGRWLALAGMVGLTSVLGYLALDDRPPNSMFALMMLGLTALLALGIVRAGPPDEDSGPRWVDPRWRAGLPFAWSMACLILLPVAVYVITYIPWALSAGGSPQLFAGWPPGHNGQTFWDLQVQMYNYHNEFRSAHGASSPWWAWPFDLKPVWAYLENMLGGTQATVIEAGNPFLFWLTIPAAAFGMWQAWTRKDRALGFVAIAALALWLPWARIDRVAFDYHYYPTLLFMFMLLAYFLAELWEGPSARTWLLARAGAAVALLAPALMWIGTGPLCWAGGVADVKYRTVCNVGASAWPGWTLPWLLITGAISLIAWRFVRPRHLVVAVLAGAAVAFAAMYPALAAWQIGGGMPGRYVELLPTWNSAFLFGHNPWPASQTQLLSLPMAVWTGLIVVVVAAVVFVAGGGRGPGGLTPPRRGRRSSAPTGSGGGAEPYLNRSSYEAPTSRNPALSQAVPARIGGGADAMPDVLIGRAARLDQGQPVVNQGRESRGLSRAEALARRIADEPPIHKAALGCAATTLVIYGVTMAHGVSFGDWAEFQRIPAELGIAHPTGFPGYVLLGKLFSLIPVGSIAWRANFLSGVAGSAAVGVLVLVMGRVGARPLVAAAAALAAALSTIVWTEATTAGLSTPFLLLIVSTVYVALRWRDDLRSRDFLLGGLLLGLAASVHPTALLYAPALVAYACWVGRARIRMRPLLLAGAACCALVGISLYAYIWIRAALGGQPLYPWLATWPGFSYWVMGTQFGQQTQGMASISTIATLAGNLPSWITFTVNSTNVLFVALAGIGSVFAWRRAGPAFAILILVLGVLGVDAYVNYKPSHERYLLLPTVVLAIWVGLALEMGMRWLEARYRTRPDLGRIAWAALALPLLVGGANFGAMDQRDSTVGEDFVASVFTSVPQGAVILSYWDALQAMAYQHCVEGWRPDITLMAPTDVDYMGCDPYPDLKSTVAARPTYALYYSGWSLEWLRNRGFELTPVATVAVPYGGQDAPFPRTLFKVTLAQGGS